MGCSVSDSVTGRRRASFLFLLLVCSFFLYQQRIDSESSYSLIVLKASFPPGCV